MKTLSNRLLEIMNKRLVEYVDSGKKLMKAFTFTSDLIWEITKFCSDGRRTRRNKLSFVRDKLEEYRRYIENPKTITWTRYLPLGKKRGGR